MSWHIRYNVIHQRNQLGKRQRVIITMPANSFLPVLRLLLFLQVSRTRGFVKLISTDVLLEIKAEAHFQPLSTRMNLAEPGPREKLSGHKKCRSLLIRSSLSLGHAFHQTAVVRCQQGGRIEHTVLYFSCSLSANICSFFRTQAVFLSS